MSDQKKNGGVKNKAKLAMALVMKKSKLATIKFQLIALGVILIIGIVFIAVMGIISIIAGDSEETNPEGVEIPPDQALVSDDVLQYKTQVNEELEKYELEEYLDIVLALMMQESGGKGNDPMQSSESYCGSVGCIQDVDLSIEKGVLHFSNVMEKANNDVRLALQSYNYGGGFIDYVNDNGGKYTFDLSVSFSQMWFEKVQHTGNYSCLRPEALQYSACYGDIMYVESVLKYVPSVNGDTENLQGEYKSPLQITLQVNSPFSWRDIGDGDEHHNGLDLNCNSPDSIHTVKDGEVVHAEYTGGYGNYVIVKHSETDFTGYGHMSEIGVSVGDKVESGNNLGVCGTTGRSTGEHLHFEIKSEMWGGFKDPASYLGL